MNTEDKQMITLTQRWTEMIERHGSTPESLANLAETLVARRAPLPPYRETYPGEHPTTHRKFVSGRLRLVYAMRQAATKAEVEPEYRESLS